MEKISLNDFRITFVKRFNFLIENFNFKPSEVQEKSTKKDNTIIHKLIYTNTDTKRIIEFVLIAEDYKTHMFCRAGETYIKRINQNGLTPEYDDIDNCFKIHDLEELIEEKFRYPEIQSHPETYINRIIYDIHKISKIFTDDYWPTIQEIAEIQQKRLGYISIGKDTVPYIEEIKKELLEISNNGFQINFDETQIPPYEQEFMGPKISYFNIEKDININITFQTRDQEFYVSSNKNSNYFYGRATKEEYLKLKQKILNE